MNTFIAIGTIRLLCGVAQFSVILFITAYLSLDSVGQYALFIIMLGYFSQLASFGFNTYLVRELNGLKREQWPETLPQQWRFQSLSIIATSLVAAFVFCAGFMPTGHIPYFYAILILTVHNNQLENYMVGAGHPMLATLSLFVRSVWIFPLSGISSIASVGVSLDGIFASWMLAELCALLFSSVRIWQLRLFPKRWGIRDTEWILRGVKTGARYTFLGLIFLVTVSVQRVILGRYSGEDTVGIFHFYFVICVFFPNLLEASLYAIILPRLIAENASIEANSLKFPDARLFATLIGGGTLGLLFISLALPLFLATLNKPELLEHRNLYWSFAGYALLYTASRIFHYQLYTAHKDRALVLAYCVSCAIACLASAILIPTNGLNGAVTSLIIAGGALLITCAWPFLVLKAQKPK